MLTREQQVKAALKVLSPAQCASEIEAALEAIEGDGLEPRPNSKEVRAAVGRLLNRLKQCKLEYKKLHKLDHAHAHGLMRDAPDLDIHIATYEEWLSVTQPPRRSAAKQKAAVKEAWALVEKYCKRKQDHSVRRRNAWHTLSGILAGDGLDHYNEMRKFRPDPGQK